MDALKIARHFNAGQAVTGASVPEGRWKETSVLPSLRDSGLSILGPGIKMPGYFQMFLRNSPVSRRSFLRCTLPVIISHEKDGKIAVATGHFSAMLTRSFAIVGGRETAQNFRL